jgi:hypothetical protein
VLDRRAVQQLIYFVADRQDLHPTPRATLVSGTTKSQPSMVSGELACETDLGCASKLSRQRVWRQARAARVMACS